VRFAVSAALAMSVIAIAAAPASAKSKKTPRIAVEPPSFDFGRVPVQRVAQKEFTIRNFGKKDLVIESVSTTCGCAVAHLETKVLKPGRTTPMKVHLETGTGRGELSRSVLVRSNDPTRSVLEVKLRATVVPE